MSVNSLSPCSRQVLPPSPPAPLTACAALIHWPTVRMAACLALVLIAGLFAWIATHPAHAARPSDQAEIQAGSGPVAELAPVRPIVTLARLPEGDSQDGLVAAAPAEPIAPVPAPASPAAALPAPTKPAERRTHQAPQTYGTQVRFLSSPEEAAEQAAQEKKLVFVLHVSGNFEESCFT